jgi:hypothetical protein
VTSVIFMCIVSRTRHGARPIILAVFRPIPHRHSVGRCLEDSAGGQALDFAILRFLDQDSAKGQALDFAILNLLSALHLMCTPVLIQRFRRLSKEEAQSSVMTTLARSRRK